MNPCTHAGPCKQLVAAGKRGPAFEPWRDVHDVWFSRRAIIKAVRFAKWSEDEPTVPGRVLT